MKKEINQVHGSMGIVEVTAAKDVHRSETEEDFVMCKHTKEFEGEESPARSKAPPQKKRRAVVRTESAEMQDDVSRQQGVEEIDAEEMEELSFIPSAVSEPRWALHMCYNKCNEESNKFYQLAAIVTEGRAARQPVQTMR